MPAVPLQNRHRGSLFCTLWMPGISVTPARASTSGSLGGMPIIHQQHFNLGSMLHISSMLSLRGV
jgi:hypothetical protein